MIRSRVVLPEPDGPSNASNSPLSTFRSTLSSAANAPNFFTIFLTSITRKLPFVQMPLENGFRHQRDQCQHRQQRRDRERRYKLVFVVENFNQQRHGVGLAANVAGYHRDRAELTHCPRITQ